MRSLFRESVVHGRTRPSARERWIAFWRLWRATKSGGNNENLEPFRVLMPRKFTVLAESCGDRLRILKAFPLELRWSDVKREKRERLRRGMGKLLTMIMAPVPDGDE